MGTWQAKDLDKEEWGGLHQTLQVKCKKSFDK